MLCSKIMNLYFLAVSELSKENGLAQYISLRIWPLAFRAFDYWSLGQVGHQYYFIVCEGVVERCLLGGLLQKKMKVPFQVPSSPFYSRALFQAFNFAESHIHSSSCLRDYFIVLIIKICGKTEIMLN